MLEELQSGSGEIEACAIVSEDGLMIAGIFPQHYDEGKAAVSGSAMIATGTKVTKELNRGKLQQVLLKSDNGYTIVTKAGDRSVLLILAGNNAKLGLIFLDIARATEEAANILS
ncbi:MAG: hypothetical protein GY757_26610 [bacterium]|nr:hypothetical protein [bacterium]